jgi:hypothetical protein
MNYAALLALLAVLAFSFPVLARLAERQGVPAAGALLATLFGALFLLGWLLIRERVMRYRVATAKIERLRERVAAAPDSPASYVLESEHLGDLLARTGRRREALEVFGHCLKLEEQRLEAALPEGKPKNVAFLKRRIGRLQRSFVA